MKNAKRIETWSVSAFVMLMAVLILKRLVSYGDVFMTDYTPYVVSDWLINYEGGFVRRGLIGQLLHWVYSVYPFDVRRFILCLPLLLSTALLLLLWRLFRLRGWSPVVLLTTCCLGNTLFLVDVRRDFLVLIMVLACFASTSVWLRLRRWPPLILALVTGIVTILTYEPSVFFAFGFLFLVVAKKVGVRQALFVGIPIAAAAVAVFVCKGDAQMGYAIWHSWDDCFIRYPDGKPLSDIGFGQAALGWELLPTMIFHLRIGYMLAEPHWLSFFLIAVMIVGTWYLVVFADVARLPGFKSGEYNRVAMSNALLMEMFLMLPMFTVLSCDWGRNITFCVVVTFFLVFFFPNYTAEMRLITPLSRKLLNLIDRIPRLRSPLCYVLVALCVPIPICETPTLSNMLLARIWTMLFY